MQILTSLGFQPLEKIGDVISCTVPSYRPDVKQEIDLIEEIIRIHGLDTIELTNFGAQPPSVPTPRVDDQLREQALLALSGLGFREICTNSLLSDKIASQFSHGSYRDQPSARPHSELGLQHNVDP